MTACNFLQMEKCSFRNCRLADDNLLVALRQQDLENLDTTQYKAGDKVCAEHYLPQPWKQVNSVRQIGQVFTDAYLGPIDKQICRDKEKRREKRRKRRYA